MYEGEKKEKRNELQRIGDEFNHVPGQAEILVRLDVPAVDVYTRVFTSLSLSSSPISTRLSLTSRTTYSLFPKINGEACTQSHDDDSTTKEGRDIP